VEGETEGGSVCGWWSLVTNVEYLESWVYGILRSSDLSVPLDLWILSVPGGKKNIYREMCVFASRMVLELVLEP